ncbi:MAG: N-6 DNA methylase [Candidatus Lokiarchaeota archaeon]|nr:N-6 DNA methylase [Candidatus Lokiarchaeota archaeon]
MEIRELIDSIFKDPNIKYELSEFENLKIDYDKELQLITKPGSGRNTGKTIYYLKTLAPFHSGKEEIQIFVEDGKSNPEEIVRQLWVYKLLKYYNYSPDQIELEKPVVYGSRSEERGYADILVYSDNEKITPKIIFEIKKPKRKDGIDQLKGYLNVEGSPVGVWSNGSDRLILYRPYPKEFDDTLSEIPREDQEPKDVIEQKRTLAKLKTEFNFKMIIQNLEELVLADSGVDEFNEIFKLIFAKIWDEKEAEENHRDRPNQQLEFQKTDDPEMTYERINQLFKKASEEWPGVFEDNENIRLRKDHLQICVGPLEPVRLLGSNLRIMDDAFEYLIPTEAKKKKGQFFTPRFVIDMCVRMLNPQKDEYIMDPACGSAGFLLHAMEWCYPADGAKERELRKFKYASKYLWGIDFETRASKTSRALMLIAGDGHSKVFGPDVNSLQPKTWFATYSGRQLMDQLRAEKLTKKAIPSSAVLNEESKAWDYFEELSFDIILTNPPFAGEIKDRQILEHYDLAKPALKRAKGKQPKEERDVLFIERVIKMLKPGGRAAIVLPQGKFNNSSLAFIREWILRKARLLAVVGLHPNTFKPHTGTKTSVLFIQKYTEKELKNIANVQREVQAACPNYADQIENLLQKYEQDLEIPEEEIPENVLELILEEFAEPEQEVIQEIVEEEQDEEETETDETGSVDLDDLIEQADEKISELRNQLIKVKQKLAALDDEVDAMKDKQQSELDILKEQKTDRKIISDVRTEYKKKIKEVKTKQRDIKKELRSEIKQLEKEIPEAEYERKLLTTKGKLQIVLEDADLLQKLSDRFIDAEVAKRLDYPIFMAVSERGGKDSSGAYEYQLDKNGNIVEDEFGNPIIDQDLVNYNIEKVKFKDIDILKDGELCIAEAFIKNANQIELSFWINE